EIDMRKRYPRSISTTVWLTPPASKHLAAPAVRLISPDATAESCSARSRGKPCDPASSRPSAETTTACATPGTCRTKSVMSQPKLPGWFVVAVVTPAPRLDGSRLNPGHQRMCRRVRVDHGGSLAGN